MLENLISNKTRVKLLLRFFTNPEARAYLRGLEKELENSSNAVRIELKRFEEAGIIIPEKEGNKKFYRANKNYPLFSEIRQITLKHFGIDRILETLVRKLGEVHAVYLTGTLAKGIDSPIVDIVIIAESVDREFLSGLVEKAERVADRKIRCLVLQPGETEKMPKPKVLVYGNDVTSNESET